MRSVVVGLTGLPGSGKDTVADYLVNRHGFSKVAFADALYLEVAAAFGVTVTFLQRRDRKEIPTRVLCLDRCKDAGFVAAMTKLIAAEPGFLVNGGIHIHSVPRSPRWILRHWGTDYRRANDEHYWRNRVFLRVAQLPVGAPVVLSDVRFPDEAEMAWYLRLWRVSSFTTYGPGALWEVIRPGTQGSTHASDQGIPRTLLTDVVNNDGDLAKLHGVVDKLLMVDVGTIGIGKTLNPLLTR